MHGPTGSPVARAKDDSDAEPSTPRWRVEMLGGFRVIAENDRDRREITRFRIRSAGALCAYLAYPFHRPHAREELIELFWPGAIPTGGRSHLSTALSCLRRRLEPPGTPAGAVLLADRASIRLNPDAVSTDVAEFDTALQAAESAVLGAERRRHLERAVALFRGELLPGAWDDWVLQARPWLTERYFRAQAELLALLEAEGERHRALEVARQGVTIDPLREEIRRELIRLLVAAGESAAALREYRDLERLLREEFGVAPARATRALLTAIEASVPTTSAGGCPGPPLPAPLTPFFGREAEIACLCEMLGKELSTTLCEDAPLLHELARMEDSRSSLPIRVNSWGRGAPSQRVVGEAPLVSPRLITLTGPGGSGKTRLAIEVARRVNAVWSGEVWYVSLVDVREPRRIGDTVREAMGLPRSAQGDPLEQVAAAIGDRPTLLVLDNFEHLVAGCPTAHVEGGEPPLSTSPEADRDSGAMVLRALLARARTLTCLVTSRQRLGLGTEQGFPVAPLPTPIVGCWLFVVGGDSGVSPQPATSNQQPATLMQFPSVQLFVDRARRTNPGFALTEQNAEAVAALCTWLEGVPLAIELAAARAAVLTPGEMVKRLGQEPGPRGGLDRNGRADALHLLGWVAEHRGDIPRACTCFTESLESRRAMGRHLSISGSLDGLAAVASTAGESSRAVRLFAAAAALLERLDARPELHRQQRCNAHLATLRAVLGETTFTALWEAGRALPSEQAVAEALGEAEAPDLSGSDAVGVDPALTDAQWECFQPLIPPSARTGRPRAGDRRVLDGILHVLRTGCGWRQMPRRYGSWSTCARRFSEWRKRGTWERLRAAFLATLDADARREWERVLRGDEGPPPAASTSLPRAGWIVSHPPPRRANTTTIPPTRSRPWGARTS